MVGSDIWNIVDDSSNKFFGLENVLIYIYIYTFIDLVDGQDLNRDL